MVWESHLLPSSGRKVPTHMGPLERAVMNHWTLNMKVTL